MEKLTKEGKTPRELYAYNLSVKVLKALQKRGFDAFSPGSYYDISSQAGLIIYNTILDSDPIQGAV